MVADIILAGLIALGVTGIILYRIRQRKAGKTGCGCNCSGCGGSCGKQGKEE